MAVAFTIVCGVALAALLVAEHRGTRAGKLATKPLASAAFIAVGVVLAPSWSGYALWILVGLALGAVGDIALIFPRGFLLGLVAFLAGHLAYVVACAQLVPPGEWLQWPALGPVLCGAVVLGWLWPHLGRMRVPVILYVATICTMVIAAIAVRHTVLTAGALLFFASDLAVARQRFVSEGFVNRAWGLPAYYSGQLLFAWSLIG